MQQEVVLALLAKEPLQGYQLRARLEDALGALGEGLNAGHVYVTLARLEKTGLVELEDSGPTRRCTGRRLPVRSVFLNGCQR